MKANIYTNKMLIGMGDLKIYDEDMDGLSGEFVPNDNYVKIKVKVLKLNALDKLKKIFS